MKEYKLTKITRYTTDKNGQPLKTRDGRDYTRVNIQVAEHGQKWVSGFGSKENANWKEGDTVEITIEQKGEYLNFSEPKKQDVVNEKLEQILNKLTKLNLEIQIIKDKVVGKEINVPTPEGVDYPENDLGEPPF